VTGIFKTDSLPLASFLLNGNLDFLSCALTGANHVEFWFRDPDNRGIDLEEQFNNGPFSSYYAAMRKLRKLTTETIGARQNTPEYNHATNKTRF